MFKWQPALAAVVTLLAILYMAWLHPVALAVIAGLAFVLLSVLIVLYGLYFIFEGFF